jgi:hypothetical protein
MQTIELYIEGQRVDMFKDESVSLTQSIQNVRDIAKIFTDFSKTFTLPASKTNNKIFKHYYNFSIENGFDGRTKKDATIELNHLPFRDGKIKLEGVDLKNNVPYAYKITFFGSTVELKDLLGEDTLSSLPLSAFNKTYSPSVIRTSLQADPASNDVIAPLITHTRKLFYDSTSGHSHDDQFSGNLYYTNSGGTHNHGVLWSDLKYAIRVAKVVEAIESKYGINFSDDFFISSNLPYYNLFLWLHRKKGSVENLSGLPSSLVNGFSDGSGVDSSMTSGSRLNILTSPSNIINYELRLTPATLNVYRVSVREDGIEVYNSGNITSEFSENNFISSGIKNAEYTVYIESESSISFTLVEWNIAYRIFPDPPEDTTYTGSFNYVATFTFDISQQIPDMKVIDFITGIFRMFNLTAFVDKITNEIVVKPLDVFYSSGNPYDISKYVVSDSGSVDVALPFREINLEFEDTETILAKQHDQLAGKIWGKESYTSGQKLDGEIYNIKLPFSKVKYERLINIDGGAATTIQYGFFVDDNQDGYLGKPLLFYPIRQTSGTQLSFRTSETSKVSLTTYNIPSNSLSLNPATSKVNINFFEEINEYTNTSGFSDTLFNVYYKNYIVSVFNEKNRLTKLTAYLPLSILLNYTLADRFIINGNSYKINSITTNLENGKSELELLNDL